MTDHERIENALAQTALASVRAIYPRNTSASEGAIQLAAASRLDAAARALRDHVRQGEEHEREVERAHAKRVVPVERALESFVDAVHEDGR